MRVRVRVHVPMLAYVYERARVCTCLQTAHTIVLIGDRLGAALGLEDGHHGGDGHLLGGLECVHGVQQPRQRVESADRQAASVKVSAHAWWVKGRLMLVVAVRSE